MQQKMSLILRSSSIFHLKAAKKNIRLRLPIIIRTLRWLKVNKRVCLGDKTEIGLFLRCPVPGKRLRNIMTGDDAATA